MVSILEMEEWSLVSYTQKNNFGIRYANGYSMQYLSKEARSVAFNKIGFDFDMINVCFSILALELEKRNMPEEYPHFDEYKV